MSDSSWVVIYTVTFTVNITKTGIKKKTSFNGYIHCKLITRFRGHFCSLLISRRVTGLNYRIECSLLNCVTQKGFRAHFAKLRCTNWTLQSETYSSKRSTQLNKSFKLKVMRENREQNAETFAARVDYFDHIQILFKFM